MKKFILFGFAIFAILMIGCLSCTPHAPKADTVVIWHWMTDRDKAFQELATKYQQETGIKIVLELYAPSDVYSQKIIAAAQANILPDIFGILDKKSVVGDFIKSGFVSDLTPEFQKNHGEWEKSFFPKALAVNRFDENNSYGVTPGIYGVPLDIMNIQMVYNKNLLKKAGIANPPQTFEEWIAAASALKRVGIATFVSGWGELWMADAFASNYAFNIMGEDKVMATFRGEIPYTDPSWIKVFKVFADLRAKGILAEGVVTKVNKDAEQDFALERAAFAFNGSWCVNVYHDMNSKLEYGIMLPPAANKDFPMKIWGGAGSSLMVNNHSANKEKAIAFLKWLTAKEQQVFLAEKTQNLPANQLSLPETKIAPILAEFANSMESTTHPMIWPLNEDSLVIEAFDKGLQSIMIGEKTPEQVAADVQKVKTKQAEKQIRRNKK